MTAWDNAYYATGDKPHLPWDFLAGSGDKDTWAPQWGFITRDSRFPTGGSFGGFFTALLGTAATLMTMEILARNLMSIRISRVYLARACLFPAWWAHLSTVPGVYGQSQDISLISDFQLSTDPTDLNAGVLGVSYNVPAVLGYTYAGHAVKGISNFSYGVIGMSNNWAGMLAFSENGTGIEAISGTQGPLAPNTSNVCAVYGASDAQHGVIGTSNKSVGVIGLSNNIGVLEYTSTLGALAGQFFGDVQIDGNFTVTGGHTKSVAVPFPDGTLRALYCMESPELWFEDFGTAKLKRGRAVVKLDSNFAKVIKTGDYRVFFTPEGDCRGLYLRRKSAATFEVGELMGGKSSIAFSYRIVGRRKDIKNHSRFSKVDPIQLSKAPARAARKPARTAANMRAFFDRVEKEVQKRTPNGARKSAERARRPSASKRRARPSIVFPPDALREAEIELKRSIRSVLSSSEFAVAVATSREGHRSPRFRPGSPAPAMGPGDAGRSE
jgi:hypothetical protein